MSLLSGLASEETKDLEGEKDSVGGNYNPLPSKIYPCTVTTAYTEESSGGAMGLNLLLTTKDEAKREIRGTLWVSGGDAKGNKPYYVDKKSGDKKFLPGYLTAESLTLLTIGKKLTEIEQEKKVIKAYDYEARAELPKTVDMVTELLGETVDVGLLLKTVDKKQKGDDGAYYPTGETRQQNEIDKFFRTGDRMTVAEVTAQVETATFHETWSSKYEGEVIDETTKVSGTAGAPVTGKPVTKSTGAPTNSLFANK